jgi:hypothetical protein
MMMFRRRLLLPLVRVDHRLPSTTNLITSNTVVLALVLVLLTSSHHQSPLYYNDGGGAVHGFSMMARPHRLLRPLPRPPHSDDSSTSRGGDRGVLLVTTRNRPTTTLQLTISPETNGSWKKSSRAIALSLSLSLSMHATDVAAAAADDDDYEEEEEEYEEYDDDENDDDDDDDELDYLSPSQIKTLRKEASKREANKVLPRIAYRNDVGITPMMLIISTFASHELVTISSIRADKQQHRSHVKPAAEQLAYDIALAMPTSQQQRPVFLVCIQGYSATYYSPFPKGRVVAPPNRIPLHQSSYKPNQWSKRTKALRDERGQIVQE